MQPYFTKEKEYGLSIDVDVALWLDYHAYHQKPPLRDAFDFVIVDEALHQEFDEFKKKETSPDISDLRLVELLQLWCSTQKSRHFTTVEKFGNSYILLRPSEVDDLCHWVKQMRERFAQEGKSIFNDPVSDLSICHNKVEE